ncbi:hypothetical protein ABT104_00005 [Streptomyces mobaraensis]|uniref:hypothetical protein n=1 Tax=Streptomyces mobaraensis TaxID=35621 RepID=UPI0033230B80
MRRSLLACAAATAILFAATGGPTPTATSAAPGCGGHVEHYVGATYKGSVTSEATLGGRKATHTRTVRVSFTKGTHGDVRATSQVGRLASYHSGLVLQRVGSVYHARFTVRTDEPAGVEPTKKERDKAQAKGQQSAGGWSYHGLETWTPKPECTGGKSTTTPQRLILDEEEVIEPHQIDPDDPSLPRYTLKQKGTLLRQ